ncbi:MAG: hypothetical protein ACOC38_05530 [Promethearchaeia archaeon]
MSDDHRRRVRKDLEERGFSLELETYLALKRRGWLSSMQSFFTNQPLKNEDRSLLEIIRDAWNQPPAPTFRTIDVAAIKTIQPTLNLVSLALVSLVIECKWRKGENWVFYCEPVSENQALLFIKQLVRETEIEEQDILNSFSYGEFSSFGSTFDQGFIPLAGNELVQKIRGVSHHAIGNIKRVALSHTAVFTKPNHDNVREANLQALSACSSYSISNPEAIHESLQQNKPIVYTRLYPVVVFSSDIWKAQYDMNNELQLEKVGWITYLYPYKGKLVSIDIVSFDSLDQYLDMIDDEITNLQRVLS